MPSCAYCNSFIICGGKRFGEKRFCSRGCEELGRLMAPTIGVSETEVAEKALRVYVGPCPTCSGPGPVDVHNSYRVWSLLLFTTWSSRSAISCRKCGRRRILHDAASSFLLGWWAPWGPIVTLMQLFRNNRSLKKLTSSTTPSAQLHNVIRLSLVHPLAEPTRPLKRSAYSAGKTVGRLFRRILN